LQTRYGRRALTIWPLLLLAIAAEVAATSLLPQTNGFRKLKPTVAVACLYTVAFALLAQILKFTDIGIAYALWAGLGTASVAVIGVLFRNERFSWKHAIGLALVVTGVVTLNLQAGQ
jgi:small multidrug resistance pump